MTLTQQTQYPWDGDIVLTITKNKAGQFRLRIRIPGWVRNKPVPSDLYSYSDDKRLAYRVMVNGQLADGQLENGYLVIDRKWKKGDRVEIHFDMEPRLVRALENVNADQGRVAVERGPLVYCAEWPDNDFDLGGMLLNQKPTFEIKKEELRIKNGQAYGINELTTSAQVLNFDNEGRLKTKDVRLCLIPYYAWNHRGPGRMMVWLPQQLRATSPTEAPAVSSKEK